LEARRDLVLKIFGREVAAAVCYVKREEAFSAKLLRGAARARFPKRQP
jgi:hypothetical protein